MQTGVLILLDNYLQCIFFLFWLPTQISDGKFFDKSFGNIRTKFKKGRLISFAFSIFLILQKNILMILLFFLEK